MRTTYEHLPVLVDEVVSAFETLEGRGPARVVDGTLGLGGHTEKLLERYPRLSVLGMEWDPRALEQARERLARFGGRFEASADSYARLPQVLAAKSLTRMDGLLLDLGLSSLQLDDGSRGFSFLGEGPLDMRMSPERPYTAWDWIVQNDARSLARIFAAYGEERFSWRAAEALKKALAAGRLKNNARAVADVLRAAIPHRPGRLDAATRCFQALRIAVNAELENVETILAALPSVLASGGRVVIIAFHSLEDRLVKRCFQQAAKACVCPPQAPQCVCGKTPWGKIITRKPIRASDEEIARNPRARSAVMRVLEVL